ncbi:hypothetical protein LOTGIDRAFT_168116 [Lottia gigantea]|uniref:Riboflavin kinase n=1 Tax=Lottia gigantea TaxID=225164 RepID=V3ZVW7_LOTGI|nr:hypothetical protein LOTGIDRAFT_168116 [Lottia gigantea]ESO85091.1 hypothetical protein LOTGIDRAFT_168116 [Lottia gigantea]
MEQVLPHFAEGEVVKGFGRGSKELGIPTANFPDNVVDNLPECIGCGVYYGWAKVDQGSVFKMVMSVGWNPYYQNKKKTMETHIIHAFVDDFYGSHLKVVMLGYIRNMKNFSSLEELIKAIESDISIAKDKLDEPENIMFRDHNFFES